MIDWSRLQATGPAWVAAETAALGLALVLVVRPFLPPGHRRRGRASTLVLALALGLALVAFASESPTVLVAASITLVIGMVGLSGLVIFDLVLARAGVQVPAILRDLVQVLTGVVAILSYLRLVGLDVLPLITTSAVLTAVIGFALQSSIANIFGGLSLQVDRTLNQGDWIQAGDHVGRILEIGWRSTRLITKDGDTVFVPNGQLVTGDVLNYSLPTAAHRMSIKVGLHYRHPPNEVRAVLVEAIRHVPGVLTQPPPDCLPVDFADSSVTYALRYWIGDFERDVAIDGEVRSRLWYAVRRAGLEIPYPIRTSINLSPTREEADAAAARELETRRTHVAGVDLFAPLDEAARTALARGMRRVEFAAGEDILRQGEPGNSLYLIDRGEVGVHLAVAGATREVATLRRGDILGEMSLLTGEARTTTCTARSEVSCYLIDYETFRAVLAAQPTIIGELSTILAARQATLDAEREGLSTIARARRAAEQRSALLPRIQSFFRLS
jgi:small-conductance mechanosensitive channel/CRP-like cAMP-binding protein